MKEYTIKVGEVFTEEKAKELREYLELKDKDFAELPVLFDCSCKHPSLGVVHRKDEPCYIPNEELAPHPNERRSN